VHFCAAWISLASGQAEFEGPLDNEHYRNLLRTNSEFFGTDSKLSDRFDGIRRHSTTADATPAARRKMSDWLDALAEVKDELVASERPDAG
jgi:hypothetical protein